MATLLEITALSGMVRRSGNALGMRHSRVSVIDFLEETGSESASRQALDRQAVSPNAVIVKGYLAGCHRERFVDSARLCGWFQVPSAQNTMFFAMKNFLLFSGLRKT